MKGCPFCGKGPMWVAGEDDNVGRDGLLGRLMCSACKNVSIRVDFGSHARFRFKTEAEAVSYATNEWQKRSKIDADAPEYDLKYFGIAKK